MNFGGGRVHPQNQRHMTGLLINWRTSSTQYNPGWCSDRCRLQIWKSLFIWRRVKTGQSRGKSCPPICNWWTRDLFRTLIQSRFSDVVTDVVFKSQKVLLEKKGNCVFIKTDRMTGKVRTKGLRGRKGKGVGVIKDKETKLEEMETSHKIGGTG